MSITFENLEKAAEIREIAENSKDFRKWAKENNKSPLNFSEWEEIIIDFYKEKNMLWEKPVAINSPYGFMGYEIFYPPKPEMVEIKPITFEKENNDYIWDLLLIDSDDESDDENDYENSKGEKKKKDNEEEKKDQEQKMCYQQDNPKRKGSKSFDRYNIYKTAESFKEYKILHKLAREKIEGSTSWKTDLQYDYNKGFCKGFKDIELSIIDNKLFLN